MMLLKKKTIIGLFLCTLVFSSSVPMLMGIQATPGEMFGGEVITLSQVNASVSLNASLAAELNGDNSSAMASAEIYAFSVVKEQPIIVRGVDLDDFLALENGTIIEGNITNPASFTVVGKDMARRTDLVVGDRFVLTGSSNSALFQLKVDAIYDSTTGGDDLLIPLSRARKIAGLGPNEASVIRVKTDNQTALVQDLEDTEQQVVISNPEGPSTPINTDMNISDEDLEAQRLAIKYLDTEQFKSQNGSYVSLFVQEGESSIKIVIVTFLFLVGALTFIGSTAIMARAIIERRSDIGILSAIGADRRYIRRQITKDILIISVPASVMGVAGGYAIVKFIAGMDLLMMFGQTITPLLTPKILAGIFTATIIICISSGIFINEAIMKATPQKMMQDSDKADEGMGAWTLGELLEVTP